MKFVSNRTQKFDEEHTENITHSLRWGSVRESVFQISLDFELVNENHRNHGFYFSIRMKTTETLLFISILLVKKDYQRPQFPEVNCDPLRPPRKWYRFV